MDSKEFLKQLFLDGLETCSPSNAVSEQLALEENQLRIGSHNFNLKKHPLYIFGVGKASVEMFNAAEEVLGMNISNSLVITPDQQQAQSCKADDIVVAAHPVPDERSLRAGKKLVSFLEELPGNAVVISLISGGTSSLLCLPAEGISIGELNTAFEMLNNSGATIHEINTVRKHCSQLKGGQLLGYISSSVKLVDLVISDVPNDDLSIIGSGPTVPDRSTYQDAYHILLEYELLDNLPKSVRHHIERGVTGEDMETLKPGEDPLAEHSSHVVSSSSRLAKTISELARDRVQKTRVADHPYNADVEEVAQMVMDRVLRYEDKYYQKALFVFYGESTVEVRGNGKGGRNQELALRGALKIDGNEGITWLSAGTDGIDGPTDAAGAIVDGDTISEARKRGLNPEEYLEKNDSYHFHEQMGTLLKTGPTGNNLMDIILIKISQ